MNNDHHESGEDFKENRQPENNSQNNEFSESFESENQIQNGNSEEPSDDVVESKVSSQQTIPVENKKKNPYKIAFFSLGGIILLSGISWFGYKFYKESQTAEPIVENACLDTDTKIYDAYKDAVVMVKHRYGYFARIKGKEIQLSVPEATEETLYGTAFFVDKNGNMISNSHVLQPWNTAENKERILTNTNNFKLKIASILTTDISEEGYETFIASNWGNASSEYYEEGDGGDYDEGSEGNSGEDFVTSTDSAPADSVETSVDIAASIPQKDYVSPDEIQVYMKTVDIAVALHDSSDEWLPCTVEKIADEEGVDLGILQLSNKQTPNTVVNTVSLENSVTDDKALKPGEKAVMIGYPLGEDLAMTNSGVKVQLYNGQISKESDGTKIQYSVTSTHGASGAPVFNNCGQLIAVNFSGVEQIQGYNFGIVSKQIRSSFPFSAVGTASVVPDK
ncbi:S1 family peptidase [Chryseobacterium caseinilyticum]|uniref:Trypsin-like peptidase domain-containing protein n=1 Tax=Chryseobacterium caseinilyticum TaxID=2771428 RepID=A0ABR8Z8G7_9FLAO|nr:serine protease [Chryseobacterium caseinilyticum]MBD8081559.1 trypsin-like peptidase domain-containing protein [Chryseobacterium caseinilyticum]